jgi:hypothetical protein
MKKLAIVLMSLGLFLSPRLFSQEMPTWDLARDLQISFTQGADGVWYFMESESITHDPSVYRLLPQYLAPCLSPNEVFRGVGCWRGSEAILPGCFGARCGLKTEVPFNFTNNLVGFCRPCYENGMSFGEIGYNAHTVRMVANWERFAIVAWQSPLTGVVKVSARIRWRVPLVTSVAWSVDKGNQTLRSGRIGIGTGHEDAGKVNLSSLQVAKGDVLYFIADYSWYEVLEPSPVDLRVTIS